MLAALYCIAVSAQVVSQYAARKTVSDVDDPRWNGMRIADDAGIIDFASSLAIGREIRSIEWNVLGSQVVVVTVDRVHGSPKAFTTELFNSWRIGSEAGSGSSAIRGATGGGTTVISGSDVGAVGG